MDKSWPFLGRASGLTLLAENFVIYALTFHHLYE